MSRNYRGREFESRWGLSRVGKSRVDKEAQVAYFNRVIKRMNKAAGYDTTKRPFQWNYDLRLDGGKHLAGTVVAFTRSEARSAIKEVLGYSKNKRLPVGIAIERGEQVDG